MSRTASVERKTSETQITCSITLDNDPLANTQTIEVSTGIGFLDHVGGPSLSGMEAHIGIDVHSASQAWWDVAESTVQG
jgi:imidazoleglycerol phosphate dehydratase HisB